MAKKTKGRAIASNSILADPLRNSPMACAMCMISQSRAIFNLFGEWRCYGDPNPVCPDCQSPMICWDTRQRHLRQAGGTKRWGRIRRLFCKQCHRLHNELPTDLSPHKHYEVEVIEDVVDDVMTQDDLESEDYPCEKTMERWKLWLEHNRPFIEGYVRSVGFRLLSLGEDFLKARESIVDYLRDTFHDRENHWLSIINRLVYNTGASLEPWPPAAP